MWHPPADIGAPLLPVSLDEAKAQCRRDADDTFEDGIIGRLIGVAHDYVEKYCGMRFGDRDITLACDSFADFAALPEAPLSSVTSITYVDDDGATQTLDPAVYDGKTGSRFSPAIALKPGQAWPAVQAGSRITVVAKFGENTPPAVQHAILLHVADNYRQRESAAVAGVTTIDMLLTNERR
jgi:uncharacterized phiE125 gp8 family phage protein